MRMFHRTPVKLCTERKSRSSSSPELGRSQQANILYGFRSHPTVTNSSPPVSYIIYAAQEIEIRGKKVSFFPN